MPEKQKKDALAPTDKRVRQGFRSRAKSKRVLYGRTFQVVRRELAVLQEDLIAQHGGKDITPERGSWWTRSSRGWSSGSSWAFTFASMACLMDIQPSLPPFILDFAWICQAAARLPDPAHGVFRQMKQNN